MTGLPLPLRFGDYTLLKLLAKGGMGEIFLARTGGYASFEKYYAIKKLLSRYSKDPDVCARFVDEAKLGARLQHPNIVQVFALGEVGGELYMASEFVDGFDLRRVLRFCHEKKKNIPLDIALYIVREILSGLSYAHRQVDADGTSINLIHRDISPQNVLVSFEGEVKIIDFGLAKSTQRSQETQANVLLGNFGYMSPEQARGQDLDVRTDVYSAGVVLFELVTRTKRFVDENPLRLLEMVARPTPVMPSDRSPDVPRAVDAIYARATALRREERYATADAFRDDVTAALHRLSPQAGRENLAQFLNHLFLGGQAPPAPDNEALDRSVAVQVSELYAQAEAFRRTKEQDAQDRRLSHFEDDAPQTSPHELMRMARVGDELSHRELTGEDPPADLVVPASGEMFDGTDIEEPEPTAVVSGFGDLSSSQSGDASGVFQSLEVDEPTEESSPAALAPAPAPSHHSVRAATGVVTTVIGNPRGQEEPEAREPTVVINLGSDEGLIEVREAGGFEVEGAAAESLVIDFDEPDSQLNRTIEQALDSDAEGPVSEPSIKRALPVPPAAPPTGEIRPAAQPAGPRRKARPVMDINPGGRRDKS